MAENNQVQKFDPSTLMEGVRDRIKSTFVSLIPDDQWEVMVSRTVEEFFKKKDVDSYNSKRYESNFDRVIMTELEAFTKEKLKEMLHSPEFSIMWENNDKILSESLRNHLVESAPKIIARSIESLMAGVLEQMRFNQR